MSKAAECTKLRINCLVNHRTFGDYDTYCRFINDIKCSILVEDVDNRGDQACMGRGLYGKSLYFPSILL